MSKKSKPRNIALITTAESISPNGELTPRGRKSARRVGKVLAKHEFDAKSTIMSSKQKADQQTAVIVAKRLHTNPSARPGIALIVAEAVTTKQRDFDFMSVMEAIMKQRSTDDGVERKRIAVVVSPSLIARELGVISEAIEGGQVYKFSPSEGLSPDPLTK